MGLSVRAYYVRADEQRVDVGIRILEADRELDPGVSWRVRGPKIDRVYGYCCAAVSFGMYRDLSFTKTAPQFVHCLLNLWFHFSKAPLRVVVTGGGDKRLVFPNVDLFGVSNDPVLAVSLDCGQLEVQGNGHLLFDSGVLDL